MIADYETFEIEVGINSSDGFPIRVKSPDGDARGWLRLQLDDFVLEEARSALELRDVDAQYLAELGDYLFAELLHDPEIVERYRTSLGAVRSQGKGLRVRLGFDEPALAAFPWEYLHDPQEDSFLAISAETALVRYVPMRGPMRPLTVTLPLRVLVAIANPAGLTPLDVRRERSLIEESLSEQQARRNAQLLVVEEATTAKINDAMKTFRPHVFHFIGHGVFAEEQAFLALEDDEHQIRLINEREFSEIFASVSETRLVVLNACQSATTSTTLPLVGLAPKLLQRQLSAVVAMQQPLSDQAALIFSRSFYRSLALGTPLDGAVSVARGDLFTELGNDQLDWGIPVIFLRSRDGRLFRMEEREQAPQALEIPPPPEPQMIPAVDGFVGREGMLATSEASLDEYGTVSITGMIGVGRTTLAAHLARRYSERYKIFWHQCTAGEGINNVIWRIAAFMAWHGNENVWNTLQSARITGSQPPPTNLLIDYVIQSLQGQDYLICLDEYQHLESSGDVDPTLSQFIARLRPLVLDGKLRTIIISDRVPRFHTVGTPISLKGLERNECLALLDAKDLRIETDLADQLITLSEGNPQLLLLIAQVVKRSAGSKPVMTRLVTAPSILDFAVHELDSQLNEAERDKMRGAAILLDHPGTRWAIEEITQSTDSLPVLLELSSRYLLETVEGSFNWEYCQHRMLQTIYYNGLLSPPQRQEMHRRAADYYRLHETDDYRAALHYFSAGNHLQTAQTLTGNLWGVVSHNHRQQVLLLLDELVTQDLPLPTWGRVRIAQGFINSYQRQVNLARQAFEEATSRLGKAAHSPEATQLIGYACWGMADLLEHEQPKEALAWVQRGLAVQNDEDKILQAGLYIKLGGVHSALGDFQAAIPAAEEGLALLGDRNHFLQVTGRENLGVSHYYQGNLVQAIQLWQEALTRSRDLRNLTRGPGLALNLAVAYMTLGEWPKAIESYADAAELSRQWGNHDVQTLVNLNLGILYTKQGQKALAESNLVAAQELAQAYGLDEWQSHALFSLADLRLRQERVDEAMTLLAEAEQRIDQSSHAYQQPELLRLLATASLATGEVEVAVDQAQASIDMAQELGMVLDNGIAHHVLAQALTVAGRMTEAVAALQQSLALIDGKDLYAQASAQRQLAQILDGLTESEEAQTLDSLTGVHRSAADLSHQADAIFERLQVID